MRYYSYNEFDPESSMADDSGGYVVTWSGEDILLNYYPYWYERMCKKLGKEYVDQNYGFEDCLEDWITVNWARESKE